MAKYLVRPELIDALIQAESGGNNNAVSPKGARGLAQIMPRTAADPGFGITPLQDNSPAEQRRFAGDYLGALLDKFSGNEALAVAAYNAGPGAVEKHGNIPPFRETQSYVAKIGRMLNPISSAQAEDKPQVTAYSPMQMPKTKEQFYKDIGYSQQDKQDQSLPSKEQFYKDIGLSQEQPNGQYNWSDVPEKAIENMIPSTGKMLIDTAKAMVHPIDTAQGLLNAASGEMYKALPDSISGPLQNLFQSPETQVEVNATATGLNDFIKNRYGSIDAFKKTMAEDPAGFLSDVSTVMSAGSGLLSKAGVLPNVSSTMGKIAHYTNPMDFSYITNPIKTAAPNVAGLATGTGTEAMQQAYKAGKTSNNVFLDNLMGNVSQTDVLDQAAQGLANIRLDAGKRYNLGMSGVKASNMPIAIDPVVDKMTDLKSAFQYRGHSKIGSTEKRVIDQLNGIVDEWAKDPNVHNAVGFDALKQRLDSVPVDYSKQRQAASVKTAIRNKVKDEIIQKAPQYADTMRDYEEMMKLEKEISRALSLGDKASKDTAMRKLQSLTRNNAQTNYGSRLELAEKLKRYGGEDIMPAVSGQAMNAWLPRGLAGKLESMATLGTAIANPGYLALLPLQSPKLMGLAAYAAGKASNKMPNYHPLLMNDLATFGRYANQR